MLVFGFCGEGIADYKFTREVVRRTVQDLLPTEDVQAESIEHIGGTQEERIIYFAERTNGYHMAFVHLDADGRTRDRAYAERFYPGYQQVQERQDGVNKMLAPIIPIRMTEAWMLADFEAFKYITGTRKTAAQLNFPSPLIRSRPWMPKRSLNQPSVMQGRGDADISLQGTSICLLRRLSVWRCYDVFLPSRHLKAI